MRFDRQVAADTGSQVISQVLTVVAVVLGAGVWGLAAGAVVKAIVATVMINRLSSGFHGRRCAAGAGSAPVLLFGVKFQASFYTFLGREQGLNVLLAATRRRRPARHLDVHQPDLPAPVARLQHALRGRVPGHVEHARARRGDRPDPPAHGPPRGDRRDLHLRDVRGGQPQADPRRVRRAVARRRARSSRSAASRRCMLGSISVAATSYLPAVGRPGIVAIASACLGVIWLGVTAALPAQHRRRRDRHRQPRRRRRRGGVLNAATKRSSGVAPYRPLVASARRRVAERRNRLAGLHRRT